MNTIYTLLFSVLTLDIPEAILIYTIEYKDEREKADLPMQIGMWILGISTVMLLVCLLPVCFLSDTENMPVFCGYIFIQYLNNALYNNYLANLRGTDRVSIIVTSSIISSISVTFFNLLFILILQWGLMGFLAGNVLGMMITDIYIIVKAGKNGIFPYP